MDVRKTGGTTFPPVRKQSTQLVARVDADVPCSTNRSRPSWSSPTASIIHIAFGLTVRSMSRYMIPGVLDTIFVTFAEGKSSCSFVTCRGVKLKAGEGSAQGLPSAVCFARRKKALPLQT